MKNHITIKNILIATLAIIAAVLLYFLLHQGKQYDSHTDGHDIAQNDNKIIIAQRNAGLKKIDSLEKDVTKRDTLIGELKVELSGTRRDLDKSVKTAVHLSQQINAMKDTARKAGWGDDEWAIVRRPTLDSLTSEVGNLAYLYDQYKANSDSLSVVVDKQAADYSIALNEQKRLYNELYSKYEQLYRLYDNLFKDYSTARKSLKREKLKTKVAALLALIAGGAAVIK